MKKFIKENWFKLGILFFLFVVAILISYYYLYLLPHNEQEQRMAALVKEQEQIRDALAKKEYNKTQLDKCLSDAEKSNAELWLTDCKNNIESLYNYCVNSGSFSDSECKSMVGMSSDRTIPLANCKVPPATASNLQDTLKNKKDDCFKEFPQN